MIPKKIHWCWFSGEAKPALVRMCVASWRKHCPDWEIREWTLADFDEVKVPPFFAEAIKANKWAFASDWARFWIVHREGGVYLDSDVELVAPIDDLVAGGGFFSCARDEPREIDPGQGFAAEAGDAALQAIVERYESMTFDSACHMAQTCPAIVTDVLSRFPNVRCLPVRYFNPKGNCAGEIRLSPETRGIHHYAASWFNWKQRLAYIWYPRLKRLFQWIRS